MKAFKIRPYFPVFFRFEFPDFPFSVNQDPDGNTLDPTCRKAWFDLSPEEWGKFVPHRPIKNPSGLLGIHQMLVQFPWMFQGLLDGSGGYFMKDNALNRFLFQTQCRNQMP